jgi:hypothetical protein
LDYKFLQWFIGFTDAEGCFLIQTKNKSEVQFCFKITLHIDDSAVLFLIKDKLGIGVVSLLPLALARGSSLLPLRG